MNNESVQHTIPILRATLDCKSTPVGPTDLTFVRAGIEHNFVNTGAKPLKLFTLYAPPEHEAGTRHANKAEADAAEGH